MAKYTPSPDCYAAAHAASGEKLSKEDIEAAFQRVVDYRDRLKATGDITGMEQKLRSFAEREAERTRIAAALQRRQAALNILVRDRLDQTIDGFTKAGFEPHQAILALMEGTQRGVEGGRNSVGALKLGYESKYLGTMFAQIERERPHIKGMLADRQFDADLMREMIELREGGKPGSTGNSDAKYAAKVFADYAELARTDLNRMGASIGKLDGWSGPQTHDDMKMMAAGKEHWVDGVIPRLDIQKSFPDVESLEELKGILGDIYEQIITGVPNKTTAKEKGQRVNPANLAKSLGKSRVLHFKDAESALAYRDEFGYGTALSGMISQLQRMSGLAAQMERFGPNPEVMLNSVVDSQRRKIRDGALSDAEKVKQLARLNSEGGAVRHAFDVMSGLATRPVNVNAASISSDARAIQSMAKLGAATITSIPSDTMTAALASQFRGSGFFRGLVTQIGGIFEGRSKGEKAEISHLLGEGFDAITQRVASAAAAHDGPVGRLSRMQQTFFKWNGLQWWTDVSREVATKTVAREMGMRAATEFKDLPAAYRHVLGMQGITEAKWSAIRQGEFRTVDGKAYVTPDRLEDLPDEAVVPMVADRIAQARAAVKDDAKFEARKAELIAGAKRELAMDVRRFVADEINYAVIETDARSRRTTTLGTRPGTFAGEAVRFVMQFKGFPVAFTQRVLGRALYGQRGATKWEQIANGSPHTGALIAGLGMAGYMAMVMKDAVKGYWPPRDPSDPKTWIAALQQGGGLGIYGDFLFGEANRFGGGLAETAGGPMVGTISDLINIPKKARDAALKGETPQVGASALNFALSNTPFANLAYVRPALDYLIVNSMRDAVSPGYLRRQETRRRKEYGQHSFMPREAF
jgi:hypothetical protein